VRYLNPADGERRMDRAAIDLACHEGFFSMVLAERFARVVGIDRDTVSLGRARRMAAARGCGDVEFERPRSRRWRRIDPSISCSATDCSRLPRPALARVKRD
jgi:tRNA/tmRNA/rRNA uracil-C5-methylase (TrmA/RlmC/RlmD family)